MKKRRIDDGWAGEDLYAVGAPSVLAPFHAHELSLPLARGPSLPPSHALDPPPALARVLDLPPALGYAHVPCLVPFLSLVPGRVSGYSSSYVGETGSDGTCKLQGCVSWDF